MPKRFALENSVAVISSAVIVGCCLNLSVKVELFAAKFVDNKRANAEDAGYISVLSNIANV